jgi:hypothetical protein
MQLIGSIIAALAIVAVTIAIVTAQLGPNAESSDEEGGDRIEQEDNSGSGRGRGRGGDEN